MNILILFPLVFCTTNNLGYSTAPLPNEGLRNPAAGYSQNFEAYFLQRLNDLELNLKKFIKDEVEAKAKENLDLQVKLYQSFTEQVKPSSKRTENNPLLKFLPYIPELTGGNFDPSLLNLFLNNSNQTQDDVIPLLLRALNSRGNTSQQTQSQNPVLSFLTNLLTNPTIDNETKSTMAFEYIKHNLTRQQDQNCPFSNQGVVNPPQPLSFSNSYGPAFNPQPAAAPVNTYGPSAPVQPTTFASNPVPNPCPAQAFTCPNQGIETREYGRNYGRRP